MPFGFKHKWWKEQEKAERFKYINVEEIIRTTARTRSSLYQEWGLGYTVYEDISQEVFDKYMEKFAAEKLTNNIIDEIQKLFQDAEIRQIEINRLWIKEYGM